MGSSESRAESDAAVSFGASVLICLRPSEEVRDALPKDELEEVDEDDEAEGAELTTEGTEAAELGRDLRRERTALRACPERAKALRDMVGRESKQKLGSTTRQGGSPRS